MEILTGEQMRRVDRRAIEGLGIPGLLLMESAGRGVAERWLADEPLLRSGPIVILCGKGNNGGDGLVVARHLLRWGMTPRVFVLAAGSALRGDAAANYRAAAASGVRIEAVPDAAAWRRARGCLDGAPFVLDAILGTGVRGGARGLAARVIEDLNRSPARIAALDLPSGIDADSHRVAGAAVVARHTYTLCRPKLPLCVEPAANHAGSWTVVPIGIPPDAVSAESAGLEWLDHAAAASLSPGPRSRAAHKGEFGHLLAVAGSSGKSGAAVLLARGALRGGVGLVTVAAPTEAAAKVAVQQSELMTEALAETPGGGLARSAVTRVLALARERDALALGPGLGAASESRKAVTSILAACPVPAVVDADGLNALALAGTRAIARLRAVKLALVLTPHPGEAGRLLGVEIPEVQADRLAAARRLAEASGAVVALKGHRTIVAEPGGRIAVNSTGNPAMASGGTGDVLTGLVGALLARGLAPFDAARLGVFLHGAAGDRAAARLGEEGVIASDLVAEIPPAIVALSQPAEPATW